MRVRVGVTEGNVELTQDRFLDAVIRVHERMRARVRAMAGGAPYVEDRTDPEDDAIIREYCTLHGVAVNWLPGPRLAAHPTSVPARTVRCGGR